MSARTGFPAAPGDTPLPLLPLGPDGIRRAPPRRTCPSARGQHNAPGWRLSTHEVTRGVATCHLVAVPKKTDTALAVPVGGEGGIRTHGAFRLTRSPSARVRPDYATSPNCACPSCWRHRHYSMHPLPPRPEVAPLDLTRGVATCQVVSSPKCTGRVPRCRSRPSSIQPADGSISGGRVGADGVRAKDSDGRGKLVDTGKTLRGKHVASAGLIASRAVKGSRTTKLDRAKASAA